MGWIYSGIILAVSFISRLLVYKKDPSLLVERGQFNQGEGTADWDRLLMVLVSIIFPILTLITAGLDYRFQCSSTNTLGGSGSGTRSTALEYCHRNLGNGLKSLFFSFCTHPGRSQPGGDSIRSIPICPASRIQHVPGIFPGISFYSRNSLGNDSNIPDDWISSPAHSA